MRGSFRTLTKVVHLLCLALWGGGTVFFSFFTTPSVFAFMRDQLPAAPPPGVQGITEQIGSQLAGDVLGAVFPVYFAAQIILGLSAVSTGVALAWRAGRLARIRSGLLVLALGLVTVHTISVYPRSVQVRRSYHHAQAIGQQERAEGLWMTFRRLHGISQSLNLLTILMVLLALVLTAVDLRDWRQNDSSGT